MISDSSGLTVTNLIIMHQPFDLMVDGMEPCVRLRVTENTAPVQR